MQNVTKRVKFLSIKHWLSAMFLDFIHQKWLFFSYCIKHEPLPLYQFWVCHTLALCEVDQSLQSSGSSQWNRKSEIPRFQLGSQSDFCLKFYFHPGSCTGRYTLQDSWCFHAGSSGMTWSDAATYCSNLSPPGQLVYLTDQTLHKEMAARTFVNGSKCKKVHDIYWRCFRLLNGSKTSHKISRVHNVIGQMT